MLSNALIPYFNPYPYQLPFQLPVFSNGILFKLNPPVKFVINKLNVISCGYKFIVSYIFNPPYKLRPYQLPFQLPVFSNGILFKLNPPVNELIFELNIISGEYKFITSYIFNPPYKLRPFQLPFQLPVFFNDILFKLNPPVNELIFELNIISGEYKFITSYIFNPLYV